MDETINSLDDYSSNLTYSSDCISCKHLGTVRFSLAACPAYPDRIPLELLTGEEKHRSVRDDQEGTTIYEDYRE